MVKWMWQELRVKSKKLQKKKVKKYENVLLRNKWRNNIVDFL